jgi:hypothetical protein
MIKIFDLKKSPYKITSKCMTFLLKNLFYTTTVSNRYKEMMNHFAEFNEFFLECRKNPDFTEKNKLKEFSHVTKDMLYELYVKVKENIDKY